MQVFLTLGNPQKITNIKIMNFVVGDLDIVGNVCLTHSIIDNSG